MRVETPRHTIYEALGRHPIHPFPARMAPCVAFDCLSEHGKPLRVLDPMAGSGTVLAVARSLGHRAIGVDIDPLAVLMSKVWTRSIDRSAVLGKARGVVERAKRSFDELSSSAAYPVAADSETKYFIRYWFDDYARRQLYALSSSIARVRDERIRDVLWCGFSRLIITKQSGASLAMDLSHSRPHKAFERAPSKPFRKFIPAVESVTANCLTAGQKAAGPPTTVHRGDARILPIKSSSVDLVLTSPPYLNAIDYMRCSKFSLVWMGYTIGALRQIRSVSVGSERGMLLDDAHGSVQAIISGLNLRPKLKPSDLSILRRYVHDLIGAVSEVARVLAPGGQAVYVVGNSTIRHTFIRNSHIVQAVAESFRLKLLSERKRALPPNRRYLPPPSSRLVGATLGSRMREEVVLTFRLSEAKEAA